MKRPNCGYFIFCGIEFFVAILAAMTPTQTAVRLHGPADLRVEQVPFDATLQPEEVLLRVAATGVCGSDLHPYQTGSIGSTVLNQPLVLGHEFSAVIEEVGGAVENLAPGMRVAVDPAWTCGVCRECREGNPNLCRHQRFCGLAPNDGSLRQRMTAPARFCHPISAALSDASAALLEPLGIALHATDLARIRLGSSVAILGAGPIGLCLAQTTRLAGASQVFIADPLPYRQEFARKFGALPFPPQIEVDVVIEAAWARDSVQSAMEIVKPGGTVVLVGIPFEDEVSFAHSVARRKGLTILMSRRMKNTYARAIELVESDRVDVESLITHRFSLRETPAAFGINAKYQQEVIKIIIENHD
ncbi:L-iditol 2-dehydrogenase [Abditibacterium utsteinense]|uniref:L-iditol 2-dehydrogenase n=1 Tax=Abditibacterium utsteinense TaxID=1960156 RepID=A0A2S8SS31_9BACT|nr:alcohol dehydrogenase catalytic domain-containing protein [Abditibacterium utsteinense]PQV63549.1 L-iditol 2-dehydrogenase [Abditibacterium utsteinense]